VSGEGLSAELHRAGVSKLLHLVANYHQVRVSDLVGPSRQAHFAQARHHAWYLLRQQGWTLTRIAHLFGRKDHCTVLHGIRKHERLTQEGKLVCEISRQHAVMQMGDLKAAQRALLASLGLVPSDLDENGEVRLER
jgi:chromosomal replication initiator protein